MRIKSWNIVMIYVLFVSALTSCSKEKPSEDVSADDILSNIEGRYVGTFTNEHHNGTYERQGTSYVGNVTITKQTSGVCSIDVICDDYGLNARIEGIKTSKGMNVIYFQKNGLDIINWKESPLIWTLNGNIGSDRNLKCTIVSYVYGKSDVEGADIYHFQDGKKTI